MFKKVSVLNRKNPPHALIIFALIIILFLSFYIGQLLWGLLLVIISFWLWMLVDCLNRTRDKFPHSEEHEKLIWILILIFLNFIGGILYFLLVKARDK